MQTYQTLVSRRTVHRFLPEPVEEAIVTRAVESAIAAPNHRLTHPWGFVWVGPETRAKLLEIALVVARAKHGTSDAAAERNVREKFMTPPALLVATVPRSEDRVRAREDYAAVCCGLQNVMLALWEEGLGSKWSTGTVTCRPETYAVLGVNEATTEIVGFLWIGKPASVPDAPRRPSLDSVLRRLP